MQLSEGEFQISSAISTQKTSVTLEELKKKKKEEEEIAACFQVEEE